MPRSIAILCLLVVSAGLIGPGVPGGAGEDPPARADQEQVPSVPTADSEVARLVELLDSDRFEVRRRAAARLEELVARPEWGRLLSVEFQRVLLRPDVSFEVRWHLERLCRRLPMVPPEAAEEVSPEEIDRLVRRLDDDSYGVRLGTARRLKWLLVQDGYLPCVTKALQSRLADGVDAEVAARLSELLELARPAMVAEFWQGRRHLGEQHLLIGVPSMSQGAQRPSHFDRIDDTAAHCVSGNNLSPGDYPVGVAFPHPKQPGAFFHLVNLPTPRRRMEYQRYVKTDEAKRLVAISRRTLDRMLAEKHELSEPELLMLAQLDPKEVSRFAGKYFNLVNDAPLPPPKPRATFLYDRAGGRPSRFGMICAQLATEGTKQAVPGLLKAIDQRRFLPPTSAAPYRLDWLAALSIAARDPWPEVDIWLGGLIQRSEILVEGSPNGPELGATAAAVLLKRHGQSLSEFGLQRAARPFPKPLVDGYRFPSADAQNKVPQWWQQEQAKRKQGTATPGL